MELTSDPHAWLRPYYIALEADGGLQKLAIPLRFDTHQGKMYDAPHVGSCISALPRSRCAPGCDDAAL